MTESIKNAWGSISSNVKFILLILALITSFSSGQLIVNPQVQMNKELAEKNEHTVTENSQILEGLIKNVEFLTQVTVATAKSAGVDTEEIRRKVDAEFRQLKAWGRE
jgi:hypothetical protein